MIKKTSFYFLVAIFAVALVFILWPNQKAMAGFCDNITAQPGNNTVSWECTSSHCSGGLGGWVVTDSGSFTTGETVGTMNVTDMNPSKKAIMCTLFRSIFADRNGVVWKNIARRPFGPNAGIQFIIQDASWSGNAFGMATQTHKGLAEILTANGKWSFWALNSSDPNDYIELDHGTWSFSSAPPISKTLLSIVKSGSGKGVVVSVDGNINCGGNCSFDYNQGAVATLTATADNGSNFGGWSGDCSGSSTSVSVTMDVDKNCTANFTALSPSYVIDPPSASIQVNKTQQFIGWYDPDGPGGPQGNQDKTSSATWSSLDTNVATINYAGLAKCSQVGSATITSVYNGITATANLTCSPAAATTISGSVKDSSNNSPMPGVDVTANWGCSWAGPPASPVSATTDYYGGYTIIIPSNWANGSCPSSNVSASRTSCSFSPSSPHVDFVVGGNAIQNFTGTCSAPPQNPSPTYVIDPPIASAQVGQAFQFSGIYDPDGPSGSQGNLDVNNLAVWSSSNTNVATVSNSIVAGNGQTAGGTASCVSAGSVGIFSTYNNITAMATLLCTQPNNPSPSTLNLKVVKLGTGAGIVSSTDGKINCGSGSGCSSDYNSGASVVLTAAASQNSVFSGWSGDAPSACIASPAPLACTILMNSAKTITAKFDTPLALNVQKTGSGSGTITSGDGKINCGNNCSSVYNLGAVVNLAATPDSYSSFAGWSGGGCSGTGACSVTMNNAKAVTAAFESEPQCQFMANPAAIILPQSSTLSWACLFTSNCSIDQGVGSVNPSSGSQSVRPPKRITYTLSCSGPGGSKSFQAVVDVGFIPWLREILPR